MLMMGMAMIGEHEKRLVPLEDRAPMRHTLRLGLFFSAGLSRASRFSSRFSLPNISSLQLLKDMLDFNILVRRLLPKYCDMGSGQSSFRGGDQPATTEHQLDTHQAPCKKSPHRNFEALKIAVPGRWRSAGTARPAYATVHPS